MSIRVIAGDCRAVLADLPADSVQMCITSPPYFGLRDYGVDGQIGLEATPDAFVAELVAVFREVRRVLHPTGTVWLNLGDSYNSGSQNNHGKGGQIEHAHLAPKDGWAGHRSKIDGLKPKDLIGIPWRVAFALQADGWWLRSDIIWAKPNPMPESVTDRPTKAHEYLFLLAKADRYYFDAKAIAEDALRAGDLPGGGGGYRQDGIGNNRDGLSANGKKPVAETRNIRSVWTIATQPFPGAHFATFPPALVRPCILAGSRPGDTVLDPFLGAGTTALVADRLGRHAVGIELNPQYAEMARSRITADAGLFADVA